MIAKLTGIGVALLLGATGLYADTIPGGDVSGNWYASHSPYYITGNITVPAGDTLTIEPAVQVNFLGEYSFTVNGWLDAIGTPADSIRFAGTPRWLGVYFVNAPDTGHLVYCRLDNASTAVTCNNSDPVISHSLITGGGGVYGSIYVSNSGSPRISDCIIINNSSRGIYWNSSANAAIDRCVISNIGMQGIFSIGSASFTISGSTISGCGTSGVYKTSGNWTFIDCTISNNKNNVNYGGGVHSEYGNLTFTNCTISDDTTLTGEGGGVACRNGTATFTNCTINGNCSQDLGSSPYIGGGGISLYHANAVLSHCTLFDNWGMPHGGGIAIDTGNLSVDHCTIDRNNSDCGMYPGSAIVIIGGGTTADITNSIISNNYGWTSNACAVYNQGSLTVDYSDFYHNTLGGHISGNIPPGFGVLDTVNYNGDSCDVYYNIFLNPMFVDTVNRDYHLLAGSPCIDAGDPASPKDPDSTITDMGRYYFNQGSGVAVGPPASLRLPPYRACPNPFTSFAAVVGHASERFSLYDISGRKVGVFKGDRVGEGLSAGVYFLRTAEGSSKPLRLVKVR
jgi:parallel beta-helix repeat protein